MNNWIVKCSANHQIAIDCAKYIFHIKCSEYISQFGIIEKHTNTIFYILRGYSIYSKLLFAIVSNSKIIYGDRVWYEMHRTWYNIYILFIETQRCRMNLNICS